jgi:hypothetical protein
VQPGQCFRMPQGAGNEVASSAAGDVDRYINSVDF